MTLRRIAASLLLAVSACTTPVPAVATLAAASCATPSPTAPTSTVVVGDAGDGDDCARAESVLRQLGCPEGAGNDAGSFASICRAERALIDAPCIASAHDLEDAKRCRVRCRL